MNHFTLSIACSFLLNSFSLISFSQGVHSGNQVSGIPCSLTLSTTVTNPACGKANGTASVVPAGGAAPYTYIWTNGDRTALADSLPEGIYLVVVTDANGCSAQAAVPVNDAGAPILTIASVTDVSCNGGSNGAIALSVAGGSSPYTYLWGNGRTTLNASNLQAGPHQIQVTDGAGCTVNKIITVNEPAKIVLTDTVKNATCGNADGAAAVIVAGGVSPYTYSWSSGPTTSVISNIAAGIYSVTVTDKNGCSKTGMDAVVNPGSAVAAVDSIIPAACPGAHGSVFISVSGGSAPYTFLWSNGATTKNLTGVNPGNYGVTIHSSTGSCIGARAVVLPAANPKTPVICLVSVDTATGKNVCAFAKDSLANLHIKRYNFYRETTTAGVYQWLGSKASNQLSVWIDSSANPLQRGWRYRVTAEDSCGNESPVSAAHKTIHLFAAVAVNNTVRLAWDNYEGFSFATFIIWKHTANKGWQKLDSVPGALNSYTDQNVTGGQVINWYYFVEVKNPNGCMVSGKYPVPEAVNLNTSKSNIYRINDTTSTSVENILPAGAFIVYPNPSSGRVTVEGTASYLKDGEIAVYNMYGEKVHSEKTDGRRSFVMDLDVPAGMYVIRIRTGSGIAIQKLIVEK